LQLEIISPSICRSCSGAQDDCTKFEVVAAAGNAKASATAGKNAGNANTGTMVSGKVDGKAADE
jgi:hypothetical protein